MFKKLDRMLPIFTLCITMLLLVVVVMAWYVENEEVTADSVIGSVAPDGITIEVNLYHINSENKDTQERNDYIFSESNIINSAPNGYLEDDSSANTAYNDKLSATVFEHYGADENVDGITAVLLEVKIAYTSNVNQSYKLSIRTDEDQLFDSSSITNFQNNNLSNVIDIYNATLENGIITVDDSASSFQQVINNVHSKSKVVDLEDSLTLNYTNNTIDGDDNRDFKTLYYVIDYNDNHINYLYEQLLNLFGEDADLTTPILFEEDIYLQLN